MIVKIIFGMKAASEGTRVPASPKDIDNARIR